MAITVTVEGFNEDGTPHLHYKSDGAIVITGPITGHVVLPDGKMLDVTPPFIEVKDEAEALLVSDAIGVRHEAEGHPDFVKDPTVDSFGFKAVLSAESHPAQED